MPPGRRSLHSGIYDYSNGHFLSEKDTIDTILLSDNGKDLKWLRHEARCLREARHDDDHHSLVRLIAFGCELLLLFATRFRTRKLGRMVTGLEQELERLRDLEKRLARWPDNIYHDEVTFLEEVRSDLVQVSLANKTNTDVELLYRRHRAWCRCLRSQVAWANEAFDDAVIKSIEDEIAKDAAKVAEVMRASAEEAS
ncbi:hypothetical protein EDB82DRAFT_502912 [Fusarium venenatum]|uniref:uncharacterized protein n=1 Tax=Fusarium venenatum TaxID=56646 RepID=UPI001D73B45B|nr:hypothetical protein EDB82DRAFT_502912 [Fusarium venenatum]